MRPVPALPAARCWRPLLVLIALLLTSCGGGSAADEPVAADADVSVLMMGNSHTESNNLHRQLESLLRAGMPGKKVGVQVAPGWMFLEERLGHTPSVDLVKSRRWTAVVLQAQKYSTSGLFSYSTAEAEAFIRLARGVGAQSIMFPEWPRRGVAETARIHDLHVSIARKEAACVAPIGQAWDLALLRHPGLQLHASDGNHSAPAGAYLAALVLYATLTGASPLAAATLDNGVEATTQAQLKQVAADTVAAWPPRTLCPADKPLASPA